MGLVSGFVAAGVQRRQISVIGGGKMIGGTVLAQRYVMVEQLSVSSSIILFSGFFCGFRALNDEGAPMHC